MIISWHPILCYVGSDITVGSGETQPTLLILTQVQPSLIYHQLQIIYCRESCLCFPAGRMFQVSCLSWWSSRQLALWGPGRQIFLYLEDRYESQDCRPLSSQGQDRPTLTTRAASEQTDTDHHPLVLVLISRHEVGQPSDSSVRTDPPCWTQHVVLCWLSSPPPPPPPLCGPARPGWCPGSGGGHWGAQSHLQVWSSQRRQKVQQSVSQSVSQSSVSNNNNS